MPPGKTAIQHLHDLAWAGAAWRYPGGVPQKVVDLLNKELALDRGARLPELLPHRARHRALGAQPGHPLPGPRLGGQLVGLLLPRRHRRRSLQARPRRAVRALHLEGARRAARHRRRLRARAPRAGDAVRVRAIWPPPRGHLRHRHPLSAAQRHPRRRQGAGAHRGYHRGAGRHGLGQLGRRRARRAHPPDRPRSDQSGDSPRRRPGDPAAGLSAPSLAARRRLRADQAPARRDRAYRQRGDEGPHLHRVGQGRHRRAQPDEGRRAGARHAHRHQAGDDHAGRGPRPHRHRRHGRHPRGGPGRLRHALPGQLGGRVPGRKPRADVDAAAPEAAEVLRPRHRGGDRPPRTDPGRHGASLPAPPRRAGASGFSKAVAGTRATGRVGINPRQDAGRTALPGAGDEARHGGGQVHPRRGQWTAPLDGHLPQPRHGGRLRGEVRRRAGAARLRPRVRQALLQADRGLRLLRLSREPCGELRQAGLHLGLDKMSLPGRFLRRAAEQPADGLLPAGPTGSRRPRARRRDPRSGRDAERLGFTTRTPLPLEGKGQGMGGSASEATSSRTLTHVLPAKRAPLPSRGRGVAPCPSGLASDKSVD